MSINIHPTLLELNDNLSRNSNYKDPTIFDIQMDIREDLLYQRKEFNRLAENVLQFLNSGVRNHALVIGSRGSGKTSIVNFILNETTKIHNFEYFYVNCRGLDNSYKIMKEIIGEKKKVPKDQVLKKFIERLQKPKKEQKKIIVLDEVDLITDEDSNLFYHLTRKKELNNVLMILISKTPKWWDKLDSDVKSSLKKKDYNFDCYDYNELKKILTLRAEAGLQSYDDSILLHIAIANANKAHSDVRIGIKVLEHIFQYKNFPTAEIDQSNGRVKISKEIVDKIDSMMDSEYQKMKEAVIRHLNDTKLGILYFCLKTKQSNIAYKEFCKNCFTKLSKSNFFKQINEMAYMDLFLLRRFRKGSSTIISFVENIGKKNIQLLEEQVKMKMVCNCIESREDPLIVQEA